MISKFWLPWKMVDSLCKLLCKGASFMSVQCLVHLVDFSLCFCLGGAIRSFLLHHNSNCKGLVRLSPFEFLWYKRRKVLTMIWLFLLRIIVIVIATIATIIIIDTIRCIMNRVIILIIIHIFEYHYYYYCHELFISLWLLLLSSVWSVFSVLSLW